MPKGLFITGTDTEVGKTWITAGLTQWLTLRGVAAGVMKPVASGCDETPEGRISDDTRLLRRATGNDALDWQAITPVALREPLSPHMAARLEDITLTPKAIETAVDAAWAQQAAWAQTILVEGVGGFLVPLCGAYTVGDLAAHMQLPVLIVAADKLGCINHVLLTIEAVRARGLTCAGVVLNRPQEPDYAALTNREALELATEVPIFGPLPWEMGPLSLERIATHLDQHDIAEGLSSWIL